MRGNWLAVLKNGVGGKAAYATATAPKMKAYAASADYGRLNQQKRNSTKKDFVAVYVAIGMMTTAMGLGLHTAWQQLRNNPTVRVKKQRRETVPEVVDPDHVAEEADKFIKHSFFRKVAHVQERSYPDHHHIANTVSKDAYAHTPRLETLKSVGVDPSL